MVNELIEKINSIEKMCVLESTIISDHLSDFIELNENQNSYAKQTFSNANNEKDLLNDGLQIQVYKKNPVIVSPFFLIELIIVY